MKNKNTALSKKPKQNPGGAPPSIVVNQIDVRPFGRREQDIPSWRNATIAAENRIPRRLLLYDLYADVDIDGHVEAVTGKRRDAVTTANWQFVDKAGKPIDEINQLIDSIGFEELLQEIINSKFWGYSILEPTFYRSHNGMWEMDANLIPRLNYRPEIGVVAFDYSSDEGLKIREGIYAKTVMEVGRVNDLGLFMKAAPYQILKRGGLGDFALFVQVFGNPIVNATWDGFDEKQRLQLLEAINSLGSGGAIVRPEGTNINLIENKSNANGALQTGFIAMLNREISKALLGSTETTEASAASGYAQSKTHEGQDERKNESDINFARRILNSRFIKILEAHGFNTKGGSFIVQGEDNELTKKETFEIHRSLATEMKLPIEDDFWYDTYGIPKPKNYDQLKEEAKSVQPMPLKKEEIEEDDDAKKDPEKKVSLAMKLLNKMGFFGDAPATTGAQATSCCGSRHTIKLADEDAFQDDALIKRVRESEGLLRFDPDLYWHTCDVLLKGFKKGWDEGTQHVVSLAMGFEYGKDDPALLTAFEQNIFRFSAGKTLAEVQELNQLFRKVKSFDEFYQMAKTRTDVFNKKWLETEYNSAVLVGESAATYHRLLAQAEMFPYWEYKTVGDHLVRPEHAELDGLILPANDPRWKKIFPPNGWNCRCYIVPRMAHEFDKSRLKEMRARADEYFKTPEFEKNRAQGWGVNRGETAEIFTANQHYITKQPGKAVKLLNDLNPADYGLRSYSQAKAVATNEAPVFKGDPATFYKSLELSQNKAVVRDYNNRPLALEPENFHRHTTGKKAERAPLLDAAKETLKNPDEVWIKGDYLNDIVYIKYYTDKTIIVLGEIKHSKVAEVSTWFSLHEIKDVIGKYRRGILVKK